MIGKSPMKNCLKLEPIPHARCRMCRAEL